MSKKEVREMMMKKEKGFTLIELMIVVAIVGILAAVAIPKFADLIDKAKEAATKGKLGALRSALSIYYGSYEGYAPTSTALKTALVTDGNSIADIPDGDTGSAGSHTWVKGTNASSGTYASRSTAGDMPLGNSYYYDSSALEIWIQCNHEGKGGTSDTAYDW